MSLGVFGPLWDHSPPVLPPTPMILTEQELDPTHILFLSVFSKENPIQQKYSVEVQLSTNDSDY